MKVRLLTSTPEAKRLAFSAIRSCYSPQTAEELFDAEFDLYESRINENGQKDSDRLIQQIVNHGHTSTMEHLVFNFAVSGVTRALLGQLTRHRVGWSYSVQSQRYVKQSSKSKHGSFGFVMPDLQKCKEPEAAEETINDCLVAIQEAYDNLVKMGVKAEDARSVLPMNSTCNLVVTCNLRSFLDFWSKRNPDTHAQQEIANLAVMMRDSIVEKEPWVAPLFGGEKDE